jgi:hypothetical protein
MYCAQCGQGLPDEAQFCWKCGVATGTSSTVVASTPSLVQLNCPRCAGKLAVSPEQNKLTCASCGSELLTVRDDQTVTLRLGRAEQELISALAPTPPPKEETCPSCGRIDQVQAVSAILGAYQQRGWDPPVTVQKLTISPPARADVRLLKRGLLLFVVGWFVGLIVMAGSTTAGLILCLLASLALAGCAITYARQKREYRQALGRYEIVELKWRTLNYCHRCDRVFIPGATVVMTADQMKSRLYAEAGAS